MTSGHDELDLTTRETRQLDRDFWAIFKASRYPEAYRRDVTVEAVNDVRADFQCAATDLIAETESFLASRRTP